MPYKHDAPPYWGTAFYEDTDGTVGWSEGYWIKTDVGQTYQQALDRLEDIVRKRLSLTTSSIVARFIRISATKIRNDTLVKELAPPFDYYTQAGTDDEILPADDAVLMRFQGAAILSHATRFLHALPKALASSADDRIFRPDASWDGRFKLFRATIINFCQLVKNGTVVGGVYVDGAATDIADVLLKTRIRDRKIGRPFGLLVGRRAPR